MSARKALTREAIETMGTPGHKAGVFSAHIIDCASQKFGPDFESFEVVYEHGYFEIRECSGVILFYNTNKDRAVVIPQRLNEVIKKVCEQECSSKELGEGVHVPAAQVATAIRGCINFSGLIAGSLFLGKEKHGFYRFSNISPKPRKPTTSVSKERKSPKQPSDKPKAPPVLRRDASYEDLRLIEVDDEGCTKYVFRNALLNRSDPKRDIEVSEKQYRLVKALIKARGETVKYGSLLAELEIRQESNLSRYKSDAAESLRGIGLNPESYIRNEPGVGYGMVKQGDLELKDQPRAPVRERRAASGKAKRDELDSFVSTLSLRHIISPAIIGKPYSSEKSEISGEPDVCAAFEIAARAGLTLQEFKIYRALFFSEGTLFADTAQATMQKNRIGFFELKTTLSSAQRKIDIFARSLEQHFGKHKSYKDAINKFSRDGGQVGQIQSVTSLDEYRSEVESAQEASVPIASYG